MTTGILDPTIRGWGLSSPPEGRTFADSYSDCSVAIGGDCPIETGFIGKLADNECSHGRLAGDRTPPCGCWTEAVRQPAPAITIEEATLTPTTNAEAPYGFKKDGVTPRLRPAPTWMDDPAKKAAADEKRKKRGTTQPRRTSKRVPASASNGTPPALTHDDAGDLLGRITTEIDEAIVDHGYIVAKRREELADAEAKRDRLVAARAAVSQ